MEKKKEGKERRVVILVINYYYYNKDLGAKKINLANMGDFIDKDDIVVVARRR